MLLCFDEMLKEMTHAAVALLTETGEDVGRVLADDGPRPALLLLLPALAAVNGLGAPWVALHHSLLKVSNEEVELLALNQVGEAAGDQPQVPVANPQAEGGRADIEPK